MIKLFSGLGIISHPFDAGGRVTIAAPIGTRTNIVVDHLVRPPLGVISSPPIVRHIATPPAPPPLPPTPLPGPLSALGKVAAPRLPGSLSTVPRAEPQTLSKESTIAPYETLFHDFKLEAYPFYNFWVADERTNDREDRGDRKLEDIPRFIKVVWEPAPDLLMGRLEPTDPSRRRIKPVKFGLEVEKPEDVVVKGVLFAPAHLQPENFSLVKENLGNGHVGPGVVNAIVEMPLNNAGLDVTEAHSQTSHIHHIDEDSFLVHPATRGVAIHELRANIHQMTNGALGISRIAGVPLSNAVSRDKRDLFDGKFAVSNTPFAGGRLQIHSVHPSSPAYSSVGRTALSSERGRIDHVVDMVRKVAQPAPAQDVRSSAFVKAKFVNPSIGGVVAQKKVNLQSRPHHAEVMVAVAHSLPNLEVVAQSGIQHQPRRLELPSFHSPAGLAPLKYVGYILEKYRRGRSGAFELIETIDLPSPDYSEYIDCKVLYGETYRYRIRSVVRWTRPGNVGPLGPEPFVIGQHGSQTANISAHKSSYFASEWSPEWAYANVLDMVPPPPPDELTVRPESARKRIAVTFRLPENPQRDIYIMRLFRKLQDAEGRDLTGWIPVLEHRALDRRIDFAPQNVLYYDTDLVDYFQVNGTRYVYTAQTISRHHEVSALSEQLGARLNKDFLTRGEFPVDFVSCAGVKPEYFGAFSVYPHRTFRSEVVVRPPEREPGRPRQPATFSFGGRNARGNATMDDATYFVRVESLDTGERRDTQLDLKYNLRETQENVITVGVYVPSHSLKERGPKKAAFGKGSKVGQTGQKGPSPEPTSKPKTSGRF